MRYFVSMMVWFVMFSVAYSGDEFESSLAKRSKSKYEKQMKEAKEEFENKVAEIKEGYKKNLEFSLKNAMKNSDLEEANRINKEIEKIKSDEISDEEDHSWLVGKWELSKENKTYKIQFNLDGTFECNWSYRKGTYRVDGTKIYLRPDDKNESHWNTYIPEKSQTSEGYVKVQ